MILGCDELGGRFERVGDYMNMGVKSVFRPLSLEEIHSASTSEITLEYSTNNQ